MFEVPKVSFYGYLIWIWVIQDPNWIKPLLDWVEPSDLRSLEIFKFWKSFYGVYHISDTTVAKLTSFTVRITYLLYLHLEAL